MLRITEEGDFQAVDMPSHSLDGVEFRENLHRGSFYDHVVMILDLVNQLFKQEPY